MPVVVHVLNSPRSRRLWIVRVDAQDDMRYASLAEAQAQAHSLAQARANSLGQTVTVRVWNRSGSVDELIHPQPHRAKLR